MSDSNHLFARRLFQTFLRSLVLFSTGQDLLLRQEHLFGAVGQGILGVANPVTTAAAISQEPVSHKGTTAAESGASAAQLAGRLPVRVSRRNGHDDDTGAHTRVFNEDKAPPQIPVPEAAVHITPGSVRSHNSRKGWVLMCDSAARQIRRPQSKCKQVLLFAHRSLKVPTVQCGL